MKYQHVKIVWTATSRTVHFWSGRRDAILTGLHHFSKLIPGLWNKQLSTTRRQPCLIRYQNDFYFLINTRPHFVKTSLFRPHKIILCQIAYIYTKYYIIEVYCTCQNSNLVAVLATWVLKIATFTIWSLNQRPKIKPNSKNSDQSRCNSDPGRCFSLDSDQGRCFEIRS